MAVNRRTFLALAGAAAGALLDRARAEDGAPASVALWPGAPPGGGGPTGPIVVNKRGSVSNIALPCLDIHVPPRPNGTAMLVAAGGGYRVIAQRAEAAPAAQWLVERGITAYVLTYRLPQEGWRNGPLAPLQDAQRALRLIRHGIGATGTTRVGVLGFSAGGHLMGMVGTRSDFQSYEPVDDADATPARADTQALAYPVITLEPPYDGTSTRRMLVGDHPTAAQSAEWSVETHVSPDCPPTFLVQAANDPISNPWNTAVMEAACQAAEVPVERHLLPSGGHGFGMGRPGTATEHWADLLEAWLKRQSMI